MRKGLCMLMTLMCLLVFSCSALAAGTTVTTFTPFADMDFAAQGYMDIVTAWEEETGYRGRSRGQRLDGQAAGQRG